MYSQPEVSYPVPANEEERLVALKSYNVLDTAEEKDFDELTLLASAICQTPVALITLVDEERQWFKSHPGIPNTQTPRELAFCSHAIVNPFEIMVVNDAREDERFANNPLVTGDTKVIFYAGVPLVNEDGHALGSLCVIDHDRKELTDEQQNALKVLASQVMNKLELKRKVAVLEKTNQELLDANVFIQKFASMAAHDLKNPLSSISLSSQALKLRIKKLQDDGCERLVDLNITSTKRLLTLIDEMLEYSKDPATLVNKKQRVFLHDILNNITNTLTLPEGFIINIPKESYQLNTSVVALEQILSNLINNAIRYNDKKEGYINIAFTQDEYFYRFEIADNGIGIAEQHHEKIFANNVTLKVVDRYNKKGTGIGLSTVKGLVKALDGSIRVQSTVGEGTTFFVTIKK